MTDAPSTATDSVSEHVARLARRGRDASRRLALLPRAQKDALLLRLADALDANTAAVLAANQLDLAAGEQAGVAEPLLDRLRLDVPRLEAIAESVRQVTALPDPVGEVVRGSTLANGLQIRQVRVPIGVLGMIYEARPNVTVDAAALAFKSGNAVLLRGGSAAAKSNQALVSVVRQVLKEAGLQDAVASLDDGGRAAARALMRAHGLVDVIIPRGGADLISTVVRESIVPVIETGSGNVHVYVDAAADSARALDIVLNSKTQRPSVCNAAESLLVHASRAEDLLPTLLQALAHAGVVLYGDTATQEAAEEATGDVEVLPATAQHYATEFNGLELSVAVVDSIDAAIAHVRRYSTGHTEAIITEDRAAARRWTSEVDAAVVVVNASTRFTDGGEFGFGAEIGISTQKLHARGPMALPELTTTTWVVEGDGHIRG